MVSEPSARGCIELSPRSFTFSRFTFWCLVGCNGDQTDSRDEGAGLKLQLADSERCLLPWRVRYGFAQDLCQGLVHRGYHWISGS